MKKISICLLCILMLFSYVTVLAAAVTVMFEIICNDGILEYATYEYQTAVIVHELGHTLGLVDYPDSYKNKSIMSYKTEIDIHYAPFPMDVKNANDCWAPHLT